MQAIDRIQMVINNVEDRGVMSVAVIGAGYWGQNLAGNLYQLGALRKICDVHFASRCILR